MRNDERRSCMMQTLSSIIQAMLYLSTPDS